jgi:hypothetical protein
MSGITEEDSMSTTIKAATKNGEANAKRNGHAALTKSKATTNAVPLSALATIINDEYAAAEEDQMSAVSHYLRVGQVLIEAKARVKHGEWMPWKKRNLTFSADTAEIYMRLARNSERVRNSGSLREALTMLRQAVQPTRGRELPLVAVSPSGDEAEQELREAWAMANEGYGMVEDLLCAEDVVSVWKVVQALREHELRAALVAAVLQLKSAQDRS